MFGSTVPKNQKPENTLLDILVSPKNGSRNWYDRGYLQFISIDPCKEKLSNLAFRIERRYDYTNVVETIENCTIVGPKIFQHDYEYHNTKNIYENLSQISRFLDTYEEEIKNSHFILIEKQLAINYKAVRLAQHILSYFYHKLPELPLNPIIVEVNSKLKSKMLGAPPHMSEVHLKEWSIQKGRKLLEEREEFHILELFDQREKIMVPSLTNKKKARLKQDDVCDTICQAESFCIYFSENYCS